MKSQEDRSVKKKMKMKIESKRTNNQVKNMAEMNHLKQYKKYISIT